MSNKSTKHTNEERKVKCPVKTCDETPFARGLHLHVKRSSGDGHGPHMEIPDHLDLDDPDPAGTGEIEMEYPDERSSEDVTRLCPYCRRPQRGKNGVMIHLGQVAGRKNHPENPTEKHEPTDFPVVEVDSDENVVEVVDAKSYDTLANGEWGIQQDQVDYEARIDDYLSLLQETDRDELAAEARELLKG